jgi:hypothetical protein
MIGRHRFVVLLCTAVVAAVVSVPQTTAATPVVQQPTVVSTAVPDTSRALNRLHDFGYTVNTPARADRAIRHWQRVNGLTVDGQVGTTTLHTLGLSAGATAPTTHPAVRDNLPPGATVEDVVRFVWPDDLEDHALRIAYRESRFVPTARNACCFGLFQIHWAVHRAWLADIGVTSPDQLLDAAINARAALALYQRAGWSPWNL